MISRRMRLVLACVFSAVLIPTAYIEAAGFLPCTGAMDCTLCAGVTMAQLVINGMIIIAFPIAAVLFAWAGGLMMTSAANPAGIQKAKDIFKSVAIGFAFVLCCWIIVDTIIHVVVIDQNPQAFNGGSWNSVGNCTLGLATRQTQALVGTLLSGLFAPGSPTAGQVDTTPGNGTGVGGNSTGGPASVSDPQLAANLTSACSTYKTNCSVASGIAQVESSGGQNCSESSTGAAGCMQVLATTACGLNASISSSCGACISSKNSLSAECAPVIQTISNNPQIGANLGVQYISQLSQKYNGNCQLIAAAYFQGPGNVQKYNGVPPAATSYVAKACGS